MGAAHPHVNDEILRLPIFAGLVPELVAGIARCEQPAVHLIAHQLLQVADAAAHHGQAGGKRLQHREGTTLLRKRGENQGPCRAHLSQHALARLCSQELYRGLLPCLLAQPARQWPLANDLQTGRPLEPAPATPDCPPPPALE